MENNSATYKTIMHNLMTTTFKMGASDLHLIVGSPPTIRVHGTLRSIENMEVLNAKQVEQLVFSILSEEQQHKLVKFHELDFRWLWREWEGFEPMLIGRNKVWLWRFEL